jgi:hypothetical protein
MKKTAKCVFYLVIPAATVVQSRRPDFHQFQLIVTVLIEGRKKNPIVLEILDWNTGRRTCDLF